MSNDMIKFVAVVILIGLFCTQYYGIDKVGWLFAPIVFLWYIVIGSVGALNIWKFDRAALKAFSPLHIYWYLSKGSRNWMSLGGIMLSITGIEALFADLSNFPVLAVQVVFILVVFPSLLLAYTGQAAFILKNKDHVSGAFYHSIPDRLYWPVVVVATIAVIIASQATITATFCIIKQALAHDCFPRVRVVHTSEKFCDQIYIPDINRVLMILCIAVTAGFKNQVQIGNAYGTAVMIVMLVTTLLMIPVMLLVWRSHWILVIAFTLVSLLVEMTYISVLFKIGRGGWVPMGFAAIFLIIMYVWHYGTRKRYESEMHSKVSMAWILNLGPSLGLVRVPGVGLVYTELAHGVPHVFSHFITNLLAIHSVVVFVCIKYLPVYTVPTDERFLVKRIGPQDLRVFRCIARYGYKDLHKKDDDFEKMLFDSLSDFICMESMLTRYSYTDIYNLTSVDLFIENVEETTSNSIVKLTNSSWPASSSVHSQQRNSATVSADRGIIATRQRMEDELDFLNKSKDQGVVHILGNTVVRARKGSGLLKKIALDYIYSLLKKIFRENSVWLNLTHESVLNVGQIFYV